MANLTTSALPMDSANPRRHTDPPNLWLTVLASSVTLHLCVVVVMLIASRFTARIQTAAIPIEVVEVTATPSTQRPLARQLPTIPRDNPRSSPSPQVTPGSRPSNPPQTTSARNSTASSSGRSSTSPATTRSTAPAPATTPRSSPPSSTAPRSTTPPQPSTPNPNTSSTQNPPTRTPAPSSVPSPVPTSPPSSPGGGGDGITASVPVSRNPPAPSGVSTKVTITGLGTGQDVPQIPPQVRQTNRDYRSGDFGCTATPESRRFFEQPVKINITIDENGKVVPDYTRSLESINPDYTQLALCLVNTWEFQPAANMLPSGQQSPVWSNVEVTVVITPTE